MTKADIVNEIAKSTGVEKVQVQQIVEAFMESVKDSLADLEEYYHHHSRAQHSRIQAR